jgi:hypothetical protein
VFRVETHGWSHSTLSPADRHICIATVLLGAATTGALIAPVALHRLLTGRRLKPETVVLVPADRARPVPAAVHDGVVPAAGAADRDARQRRGVVRRRYGRVLRPVLGRATAVVRRADERDDR